jgi:hypothetical protein
MEKFIVSALTPLPVRKGLQVNAVVAGLEIIASDLAPTVGT